ncbi:hypothetical protein [Massilia sp. Mn16-1_5]|nr:hypothetical protein [Massilia sp. Mn16-1_5]
MTIWRSGHPGAAATAFCWERHVLQRTPFETEMMLPQQEIEQRQLFS